MQPFIRQLLKDFSPAFAGVALLSAVAAAMTLASITVVERWLHNDGVQHQSWSLLIALLLVLFASSFFSQLQLEVTGERILRRIRHQLLSLLAGQYYYHLQQLGPHRLMTSLTEDIYNIATAFSILPMFLINFGILLLSLIYLFTLSPGMLLVLLLILLIGAAISISLMQLAVDSTVDKREQQDKLYQVFRAATEGLRELNLLRTRRAFFLEQVVTPCLKKAEMAGCRNHRHWAFYDSWTAVFFMGGIFILVYCGMSFLDADQQTLQSFILFSIYLCGPVQVLAQTFNHLITGKIALSRLQNLGLQTTAEVATEDQELPLLKDWQQLAIRNLSFSYQQDSEHNFALAPVNFDLRKGEIVFLQGGNGSGKTTLIHLLLGLYRASDGSIALDNHIVLDPTAPAYQQLFSCIFADGFLFEHLLDQHGVSADIKHISPLLQQFGLSDIPQHADGSFDTNALSRGQRKRYALIQLLLEDAPICVFDEWAAEQDPKSRAYFYLELLPQLKAQGKAVIVISHDERYFDVADRMYHMNAGHLQPTAIGFYPLDSSATAGLAPSSNVLA
ncbi:cyclic peptide export ABC transporter [Rheinheimera riviphila]|nr:cyclic peptide export ABC transporter [Rheinheimera riviphila]